MTVIDLEVEERQGVKRFWQNSEVDDRWEGLGFKVPKMQPTRTFNDARLDTKYRDYEAKDREAEKQRRIGETTSVHEDKGEEDVKGGVEQGLRGTEGRSVRPIGLTSSEPLRP